MIDLFFSSDRDRRNGYDDLIIIAVFTESFAL